MRVGVGEPAGQQHPVRGQAGAGHLVVRLERGLLHLGVAVGDVAVEHQLADLDQRVVAVRPHLGQVERVEPVGLGLLERHDLHLQRPARVLPALDRGDTGRAGGSRRPCRRVSSASAWVRNSMPWSVMKWYFTQKISPGGVDPAVGVAAVAVHVPPGARDAPVAHQPSDLVRRLRGQRPEVPLHVVVAQAVVGAALLRRMKCWNFSGSRMKNTGVLFPTMSRLPSEV